MLRYCNTVAFICNVWRLKCKEKIFESNFMRKCNPLLSVQKSLIVCS